MTAVTVKRFTLDEYHRLGELGFFCEDERVELIRGEIIQRPTKKTLRSVCNTRLNREPYQDRYNKFSYRSKRIVLPNEIVTLPCFPGISLNLTEVFPGAN